MVCRMLVGDQDDIIHMCSDHHRSMPSKVKAGPLASVQGTGGLYVKVVMWLYVVVVRFSIIVLRHIVFTITSVFWNTKTGGSLGLVTVL